MRNFSLVEPRKKKHKFIHIAIKLAQCVSHLTMAEPGNQLSLTATTQFAIGNKQKTNTLVISIGTNSTPLGYAETKALIEELTTQLHKLWPSIDSSWRD